MEPIHPKERELRLPDRAEERDPGEGPGEVFGEDRNHAGPTPRGRNPAVRPPARGVEAGRDGEPPPGDGPNRPAPIDMMARAAIIHSLHVLARGFSFI